MWFPVVAVENVYIFPGVPEILQRKFERIKEMFREAPFHLREVYLQGGRRPDCRDPPSCAREFSGFAAGFVSIFRNPVYSIKLTLESKDAVISGAGSRPSCRTCKDPSSSGERWNHATER